MRASPVIRRSPVSRSPGHERAYRSRDDDVLARFDHVHGEVAEEGEPLHDAVANRLRMLADPGREGDCVEAAERDRHRSDGLRDPVGEDVDCEPGRLAHVFRPAEREDPGLVLERMVELVERYTVTK